MKKISLQEKLEKIAQATQESFVPSKGNKIRRGVLHRHVLDGLGLSKSKLHVKMLKAILKAQGAREVRIHGKCYYAGLPNFWTYRE